MIMLSEKKLSFTKLNNDHNNNNNNNNNNNKTNKLLELSLETSNAF